jgi:hypothetical protein
MISSGGIIYALKMGVIQAGFSLPPLITKAETEFNRSGLQMDQPEDQSNP